MNGFYSTKNYKNNYFCDSVIFYIKEISEIPLLTAEEEKYYSKLAFEKNSYAQNILIQHNLKLVVSIAKKYYCPSHFQDLIQEGNLGLIHATQKFDYRLGYKFSTYVTYWITQAILKYLLYKKRLIYIPQHIYQSIVKIRNFTNEYTQIYKVTPSIELISESLKISYRNVVLSLLSEKDSMSFHDFFNQENEYYFEKFFSCTNFNPEFILEDNNSILSVNKLLDSLTFKEKEVISKKFGLNQTEPQSFKEIGHSLNLSSERIRQIQNSSLNKLKLFLEENPDFLE